MIKAERRECRRRDRITEGFNPRLRGVNSPAILVRQPTFLPPVIQTWSWAKKEDIFVRWSTGIQCLWWINEVLSGALPGSHFLSCVYAGCPLCARLQSSFGHKKILFNPLQCPVWLFAAFLQVQICLCWFWRVHHVERCFCNVFFFGSPVRWCLGMAFCWSQALKEIQTYCTKDRQQTERIATFLLHFSFSFFPIPHSPDFISHSYCSILAQQKWQ